MGPTTICLVFAEKQNHILSAKLRRSASLEYVTLDVVLLQGKCNSHFVAQPKTDTQNMVLFLCEHPANACPLTFSCNLTFSWHNWLSFGEPPKHIDIFLPIREFLHVMEIWSTESAQPPQRVFQNKQVQLVKLCGCLRLYSER